jgi:hypothetical protein
MQDRLNQLLKDRFLKVPGVVSVGITRCELSLSGSLLKYDVRLTAKFKEGPIEIPISAQAQGEINMGQLGPINQGTISIKPPAPLPQVDIQLDELL